MYLRDAGFTMPKVRNLINLTSVNNNLISISGVQYRYAVIVYELWTAYYSTLSSTKSDSGPIPFADVACRLILDLNAK